jgi:tetratricopeptide (TPR) repeat protein
LKVALFQFATNAVGKVPAVFENILALYFVNALEKAADLKVEDLAPPPREGEVLSLTKVLAEADVREAAEKIGADLSIWGSLNFGPGGEPIIKDLEVNLLISGLDSDAPVVSRRFRFDALRGDVKSAEISVEITALEDLVEEMLLTVVDALGYDAEKMDLARIGEGLTYSDRAMVYFVYARRITMDSESKLRLYLKAVSADPYFALAYINAAQLLIGEERYGEAMNLLLRAQSNLEGSNLEPDILNLLGVATMHLGMWEEAVNVWERSLDRRPDYVEVLCNLAAAHSMRDLLDEAEEFYRSALSFDEEHPLAWFSLGRLLAKESRYEEAEEAMRRYIGLTPGDPWAYNILGTCLVQLGKMNEAEFELAKAAQLDPDGEAGALARQELQQLKD